MTARMTVRRRRTLIIAGVMTAMLSAPMAACGARRATGAEAAGTDATGAAATPVPFAPGVVSNDSSYGATFTPDGRAVYFTRLRPDPAAPGRTVATIMESRLVAGRWETPRVAPFAGTTREIDPFVTPDGRHLLFNSSRPGSVPPPEVVGPMSGLDVWLVERVPGGGWGPPRPLPPPVNTPAPEFYATATRDGTLYFVSVRPDGVGGLDLYRARRSGAGYAAPENLGAPVNTVGAESNVYVDPDERYVIFYADRPGGYGQPDLYVSYRRGRGWGEPRNLGPAVNTPDLEFCPAVSPDGRTFYFSRIRARGGRPPVFTVYAVPLAAVLPPP